jgi:hypothetical protein
MRLTDEQIGAELHALRPTPGEEFAEKLDRLAAASFPASARKPVGMPALRWSRLAPALGALLVAAVVIAVVASRSNDTSFTSPDGQGIQAIGRSQNATGGAGGGAAATAQQGKGIAPSQEVAPSPLPPTPVPPSAARPHNGRPQIQERSASLGLSTDAGKLQDAADGVIQVTDRYDGFVDSSTVHAGGSIGHASFALRIPTIHVNDALADLSALGHVTARDEGSTNVTPAYTDAGKTFRDARAKVDSLRAQLQNASSPAEAAAIRQQLDAARDQLAAARAVLRGLKQRVALTPVQVEITAHGDGSWSIGDAAAEAVSVLEAIAGATLIALAVLVPLAALCALGWLGARELQRRQRESSLDR